MTAKPEAKTRTEWALAKPIGSGRFVVKVNLDPTGRWNEHLTAQDAIDRWYPDAVVVARTVTTYADDVTEWDAAPVDGSPDQPTEGSDRE